MVFFKSQRLLEPLDSVTFARPFQSELGDLHEQVWDWALNRAFSYNPDRVSVIQINIVFFIPRGWWNFPLTFSNFGCTRSSPVWIASLCRSWTICIKVCGIDFSKTLFHTFLIWYLSTDEYFGLWVSQLPLNMVLFNPRGWWNFTWICQVLAALGLLLCWLSSYAC